jgi:hypothetical protein
MTRSSVVTRAEGAFDVAKAVGRSRGLCPKAVHVCVSPSQVHSATLLCGSGWTPNWRSMFRHWARWCVPRVATWARTAPRVSRIVRQPGRKALGF